MKSPAIRAAAGWVLAGTLLWTAGCAREPMNGQEALRRTWQSYKALFVDADGRVRRPESGNDTVSEAQAYTMLRAVWMNDRETFDRCYRWTETHLSREAVHGDSLLAWKWVDGAVVDWMPASDADIDYALALIFAGSVWKGDRNLPMPYFDKARQVLRAVLEKEMFTTPGGTRVLAPWIQTPEEPRTVNPGYFSPAHFKIFYQFTGDSEWQELADGSYRLLGGVTQRLDGRRGVGLVPDWASLDGDEWRQANLDERRGRGSEPDRFGWDAVRMPFRIGLDRIWFGERRADELFGGGMAGFFARELRRGSIKAGYHYDGRRGARYSDPLFYAAAYFALRDSHPDLANRSADEALRFLTSKNGQVVYHDAERYFTNALSWMSEAARQGAIRNLWTESKEGLDEDHPRG